MTADPTVSMLMAAYAPRAAWLREAVASALAQRDCSAELIVVDDGSPQPVAELLAGFDDPRLQIVRIEHGGVPGARNTGIEAATGAYLRFIDSDDVYPPRSTARLVDLAEAEDEVVIACGATRWCREDMGPIFDWPAGCPRDAARSYLLSRCTPMVTSMLFPRALIAASGQWDPRFSMCADTDFVLRALELAPVVETREAVSFYRQRAGSVSGDPVQAWRGTELVVKHFFERHPEARDSRLATQVRAMLDLMHAELDRRRRPWLQRRFWRGLGRDPTALQMAYVRLILPRLQRLRWRAARRAA